MIFRVYNCDIIWLFVSHSYRLYKISVMMIKAIISVSLVLFSVIDIPGCLPVFIDMRKQGMVIKPFIATVAAGTLMVLFLYFGTSILGLFGIDIGSFALAGSLILFFMGLEMILGIQFFRNRDNEEDASSTLVPVVFPLLAGAGTLTTIISLKAEFSNLHIVAGIIFNLIIIYIVLNSLGWFSKRMSPQLVSSLRKIFGILLIAIAIQMFKANIAL